MKKIVALLFVFVAITSCTQDITKNDPAMEAFKDDVRWRARDMFAEVAANGSVTITGLTTYETLTIKLPSLYPFVHPIGENHSRVATFTNSQEGVEAMFTSGTGFGDGEVDIDEYDIENQTISGTFRFNLINSSDDPEAPEVMNFQHGVLYKVPVVPAIEP